MRNKLRQIIRDEIAKGYYEGKVIQDAEQAVGANFVAIMRDFIQRQKDDENFDLRQERLDLYDELCFIYEHFEKSQDDCLDDFDWASGR